MSKGRGTYEQLETFRTETFGKLDTDRSGTLSQRELETAAKLDNISTEQNAVAKLLLDSYDSVKNYYNEAGHSHGKHATEICFTDIYGMQQETKRHKERKEQAQLEANRKPKTETDKGLNLIGPMAGYTMGSQMDAPDDDFGLGGISGAMWGSSW